MKQMKKSKAVENDEISFEMFEASENFGLNKTTYIANYVYEKVNDEIIESISIAIQKKPGAIHCKA